MTEAEVEHAWLAALDGVRSAMARLAGHDDVALHTWLAPLFPEQEGSVQPENFKDHERRRQKASQPLDPPASLPGLPAELASGYDLYDSFHDVLDCQGDMRARTYSQHWLSTGQLPSLEELRRLAGTLAQQSLGRGPAEAVKSAREACGNGAISGADADAADVSLHRLRSYLSSEQESSRKGRRHHMSAFPSTFNPALAWGPLSRRRVHFEAQASLRRVAPGPLAATPALAAARTVEASEVPTSHALLAVFSLTSAQRNCLRTYQPQSSQWHHMLAKRSLGGQGLSGSQGPGSAVRYWRWRGALVEYTCAGSEGPVILLLHGFGAFLGHYRSNIAELAGRGNRVWAVTMPGFGRSEKPYVQYTQYVWSDFVRDFIELVIKEPALVAGNSIGGYTAAMVAGDNPQLVTSLVLLNSAGKLDPRYLADSSPPSLESQAPSRGAPYIVAWFLSRILFFYLQSNVSRILKRCYPKDTSRADQWLVQEIIRASHDPGALEVVESAFYLPKPRPLNQLIDQYGGPVLVLQGKFDPLNDAVARANALKACCPGVALEFLDAGHCPHDEVPDLVCQHIDKFARASYSTISTAEEEAAERRALDDAAALAPVDVLEILEEEVAVAATDPLKALLGDSSQL
eukprot:SM000083S22734  [mRNA]  locus=s83:157543:163190:- [translate_table: standard]